MTRRATTEELGLAIIKAIHDHEKEIDPENRPGFMGIRHWRRFVSYLPRDYRDRVDVGWRWVLRHPQYGVIVKEPHGPKGSIIALVTDPAHIDECAKTARFNRRYGHTRETGQHQDWMDALAYLSRTRPGISSLLNVSIREDGESKAHHRSAIRALAEALSVSEVEAEQIWLTPSDAWRYG